MTLVLALLAGQRLHAIGGRARFSSGRWDRHPERWRTFESIAADVIAQLAAAEVASRERQVLAILHRSTYAPGQAGRASSRRANGLAATERSAPGLRANARGQQLSWIREDQMARPESFILDEV
ncbi:MAG: hypothetical protein JO020_08155 [Chloroflexi bacterium]|nr:hypothetical protein [Chloroflexota bacterium]